ncbi:hypothetical protein B7P43_G15449 [Cryptotermes secundus]|uniref:Uncharacterized protein n=1 Tax=Cryptotermes secundus TaxID=105785 RepID=A0A2J7QRF6_9NEOP|nr:hypothetical protein B7P43_G15449 [Cryptotermes secundus]
MVYWSCIIYFFEVRGFILFLQANVGELRNLLGLCSWLALRDLFMNCFAMRQI